MNRKQLLLLILPLSRPEGIFDKTKAICGLGCSFRGIVENFVAELYSGTRGILSGFFIIRVVLFVAVFCDCDGDCYCWRGRKQQRRTFRKGTVL